MSARAFGNGQGLRWPGLVGSRRRLTMATAYDSGNEPEGCFHEYPKIAVLTQQASMVNLFIFTRNKNKGS